MAEYIKVINQLKQLPEDTHIFCARQSADDVSKYNDDHLEPDDRKRVEEAKARSEKFFSVLPLLAYDGPECQQFHDWIYQKMNDELEKCELCIRNYYLGKIQFKINLLQEYDPDEVQQFLTLINRRDVQRIREGLKNAQERLESLPEQNRAPGRLETKELFALFEALHCEPFFSNEEMLKQSFDRPFKLVQSRKELKVAEVLPAVTKFLFSTDGYRLSWAVRTWGRLGRSPTEIEWDWAIKDILMDQLQQVKNDQSLIRYWSGLKVIISKLTKDQIAHKLFDLTSNFAKLALDHLGKQTFAIPQIMGSLKSIFEKDSNSFWQALVSVSPSTVAEQVFASPQFGRCLQNQVSPQNTDNCLDVLSWITPFLDGLIPANRPAACHTLAYQLFQRIRSDESSSEVKQLCFEWTVNALSNTISGFVGEDATLKSTGRLVLCDALATVSTYIGELLRFQIDGAGDKHDQVRQKVLDLVRNTIALECQCLKVDFEALSVDAPKAQSSSFSSAIWQVVIDNLDPEDVKLSAAAIRGTMSLPGLEPLRLKNDSKCVTEKESFNRTFNQITGQVSELLDRLSGFPSTHLDPLFSSQDTCMALMANLFSPDQATYQAAVDLIKNISGASGRKEALTHLLDAFLSSVIFSICWVFRRVSNMSTFASVPRMLKTGMEILDILCDATGILRNRSLADRETAAIQSYWGYQWSFLAMIFRRTEKWSIEVHDKPLMTDVCRDTMQYAQELFQQYYLFSSLLQRGKSQEEAAKVPKLLLNIDEKSSSGSPPKVLDMMVRWLRLRDPYLAETLSRLIIDMLGRLKDYGTVLPTDSHSLTFIKDVSIGSETQRAPKTILSANQKAALIRALENYTGQQIAPKVGKPKKQQRLDQWTEAGSIKSDSATPATVVIDLEDDYGDEDIADEDLRKLESHDGSKQKPLSGERPKVPPPAKPPIARPTTLSLREMQAKQSTNSKAFIEKRKQEEAARKARDRELALKLRGKLSAEQTANAGSGLTSLGVQGKDHSAGRSSLMVSSESEAESEDDEDDELFGGKVVTATTSGLPRTAKVVQGPVRKIKQVRSAKDMRARLAPDLTNLHKTILGWDFFADTDTPPNSGKDDYTLVTNTFRTVEDYQKTFEPLLVLEGWQSFRSAREDGNFKSFEVKVANSLIVDNFFEVNTQVSMAEGKELGLGTSDVVLLSKSKNPHKDADQPHCLARVKEISRKKGEMQIVYRVNAANNPMRPFLNDKATVYGIQILSLTPLEREYGALMALPYYDLCEEIIRAKPSPLLEYRESELQDFQKLYKVNLAQAKAVKSAVDNDAFTLIQGPPGSGKTKTICAIVGAIMTGFIGKLSGTATRAPVNGRPLPPPAAKKVLVCAPSNAAVDELVMRFKDGIRLMNGSEERINVVRLGRSDAINAAVKDVTLEELVNAKLSEMMPSNINGKEDIHGLMQEHKAASNELFELRNQMSATRASGGQVSSKDDQLAEGLQKRKVALSTRIDDAREKQNSATRDADINRKRVQQEILDSAHVLCATLSGSGHEIFQGLNVEFETVIIDEAAQSIELSALIPLKYGCSKCILVGDPKQLPPTVLSRQAAKYQYEQSLFARMEGNHKRDVHLLDTQYRMHPQISAFPSKTFYDSRLQDGPEMARLRARPWHHSAILAPYRFFDVEGMSESATKGHSLVNKAEINVAIQLYDRLISDVPRYDFRHKIGIITPYKGQLKELKRQFTYRYGEGITSSVEFNTTDAFQGRESEIIIFSCVRANTKGIGFLNDVRRMNVGLTRAKCSLWVLGNSQSLVQGEFWRALVSDAKSRDLYTGGDILALLRRPLLTEDMMKDDIVMADIDSPVSDEPKKELPDSAPRKAVKSEASSPAPQVPAKHDSSRLSSGRSSPMSRPEMSSRRSSSTSFSAVRKHEAKSALNDKESTVKREVLGDAKRSHSSSPFPEQVQRKASLLDQGVQLNGPSGGMNGLNPNANCSICGSNAHISKNCDNEQARKEQLGICERCRQPGHTQSFCTAVRCLDCGEIGHEVEDCNRPSEERLNVQEKTEVQRQEGEFRKYQQRARERRAQKQLGEHGGKIPAVKSSISKDTAVDGKRKRDDSSHNGSSKLVRTHNGSAPVSIRPPSGAGSGLPLPRGPPPGQAGLVRKKKTREDDMFTKRR